jgi:hypothetical protein
VEETGLQSHSTTVPLDWQRPPRRHPDATLTSTHSHNITERLFVVGDMRDRETRSHDIERVVTKRKCGERASDNRAHEGASGDLQHLNRCIDANNASAASGALDHLLCDFPGAGSDIQDPRAFRRLQQFDRIARRLRELARRGNPPIHIHQDRVPIGR